MVFTRIIKDVCPWAPFISDHSPVPDLSCICAVTVYVDNLAVLGTNAEEVTRTTNVILAETHRRLRSTHDEEDASSESKLLGMQLLAGHCLVPTPDRRWRLYHAVSEVLARRRLTSRQLHSLVGIFTFFAMIRME